MRLKLRNIFRLVPALLFSLLFSAPASAAVTSVTPSTWNVVGLDSNDVNSGPNRFPVGAKVCGGTSGSSDTASFTWDTGGTDNGTYIYLRTGSANPVTITFGADGCADAYFEVEVARNSSAYDKTRRYHITAGGISTPTPREIYVEHLVSQSRNAVTSMEFGTSLASLQSVAAGGSMNLLVGNTYYIKMHAYTATQGYEQLESFVNFPNTVFQVLSVSTTYTADSSSYVSSPNDKLYGDGCSWENDPNNPYYRSCLDDGKVGGTIVVTYQVKILSVGSGSETLNSLIHDFSGSSYHYNADFSTSAVYATILGPSSVTINKSFAPNTIAPNGTSTMTIKLTNPTSETLTGVNFSDSTNWPSGMTVASLPNVTYSGCGAGAFSPALVAGATSASFSGATLSPNSVCTITVDVTAPSGTYTNTTNNLFINSTVDTGNTGSDTLTASIAPACTGNSALVSWTVPSTATNPPDTATGGAGSPTTNNTGYTAAASALSSTNTSIATTSGYNDTASWSTYGYKTAPTNYVQFAVDTRLYSGVQMTFWLKNASVANGPTTMTVSYDNGAGFTSLPAGTISPPTNINWTSEAIDFTGKTSATGTTTFRIASSGAKNDNAGAGLSYDVVTFTGCRQAPPAPTITKSFSPTSIAKGSASTLTFNISNTSTGNKALTGVAITDTFPTLPAAMTVALPLTTTNTCGGALQDNSGGALAAGDPGIKLTGGSLAAGGSCSFSVKVTAATAGLYQNVSGNISSTESGSNTNANGYATASLTVIAPPTLAKSFSPASIYTTSPGNTSTLTFTITNSNLSNALNGIGFTDTLPAGLTVPTSGPTAICNGSLTTTSPSSISFTGGARAANTNCSFNVTVTGTTAGTKNNTTSAVTSTEGGNGNTATASIVVIARVASIDMTKHVSTAVTGPWANYVAVAAGSSVYYRFKIYNSGDVSLYNVGITETAGSISPSCTWPEPLAVGDTAYCVSSAVTAIAGSNVNTAYAHAQYPSGGATYNSANSSATYATKGLTITKSVTKICDSGDSNCNTTNPTYFNATGEKAHYSYTVTNTGYATLLGPVTVSDNVTSVTPNVPITVTCPAVSTVGDGDNYLDAAEAVTCTATYTVTSADVAANLVTNTASASTSSNGYITAAASNTASKTLIYFGPPTVAKSFNPSGIEIHGTSVLTITLTNPSSIAITGAAFTDNYPTNLVNTGAASATITGNGCTGTLTGANNGSSLTLSGATIPANNATCTYTVNVTSVTPGTYNNSTGNITTANTRTASPAYATLTVSPSTGSVMFVSDLSGSGDVTQTYPGSTIYIKVNDWDRNTITTTTQIISVTIATQTGDNETVTLTETGVNTGIFTGFIPTATGAPASGNGILQVSPIEIVTVTYIDTLDASFNPNQPRTDNLTVQYAADLSITKATSNNTPNEGDPVVYTLTVTNNGPNSASGIQATDLLPLDVTYVSDSGNGSYNRITGLWLVPNLAVGASASLTITTTVNSGTIGKTITNSASITAAAQIDLVSSNNTATQSTVVVGGADIAVTKTVNVPTPPSGGAIVYTVTVTNNGNNGATGLKVTDQLPAGVSYSSSTPSQGSYDSVTGVWNIGSLAKDASVTLAINANVTAASGSTVTNTASETALNEGDPVSSNNSANAAIIVGGADLSVAKSVNNATPNEGNSIAYTITVTNNGSNTANSIEVTDQLPAGVSYSSSTPSQGSYVSGTGVWSVGTLANGVSATLTINATVNSGTSGTTITNTAIKTASDKPDPASTNDSASVSITVQRADLRITKTVNNNAPSEGATITYTLTVANNGPNSATNITVTDVIPNGLTYVSNSGGASYNGGNKTVTWSIASPVTNGSNTSLNITCTVDSGTNGATITNTANIASADQADPNSSNNSASVSIGVGGIDIAMTKTVNNPTPAAGGSVTFTITATNNGPNNATGVQVTDLLPAGLTYSSDTPSQGTYNSGTGIWDIGALNNGAAVTLTMTATVSGALGQTITNTASRTASTQTDANTANDNASASIVVGATDLAVSISVSNPTPNVGNSITYTVTLTNNGPNNATGVTVTDILPPGLTYSSSTPSQGTYTSGTGVWAVGALANGSSVTLGIVATVNSGTGGNTIIDAASITAADQSDTVSSNNSASVSITVQSADILINYTVDNLTPYENSPIVYIITVTNNGPHDATGVAASVPLPAGVTYLSDDGGGAYGSSTWTIGNLAKYASVVLRITVRVNMGTGGTTITSTASKSSADQADPDASNNSATVTVSPLSLPNIVMLKSVLTYSDPRNDTNNPKAIPGASMLYTIQVKNMGLGPAQNVVVTDPIPTFTELDVNGSGSGPVSFVNGSPVSGLSYSFITLGSGADNISFSNNNGADYNYTPVPVNGFEANVTNIKISLGGVFNASDGTNHPSFELRFKVRIK